MEKRNLEIWNFSDNKKEADYLFSLVKRGNKTATSYLYSEPMDNEKFNILTNWDKTDRLLIETTSIKIVEFKDVTKEHAIKEGEGNLTLRYWRKVHKKIFKKELKLKGQKFNKHTKIICEEFKIKENNEKID